MGREEGVREWGGRRGEGVGREGSEGVGREEGVREWGGSGEGGGGEGVGREEG